PRREPLLPPFLKSGSLSWIRTMTFMQPYGPGEEPIAILLPAAPKGSRGVDPTTGGRAGGYPSGQTQSALILARFDHPRGVEAKPRRRGGFGHLLTQVHCRGRRSLRPIQISPYSIDPDALPDQLGLDGG